MLKGGEQAHCVKEQQTRHKQMKMIFYIQEKKSIVCVITETRWRELLLWLLSKPCQHLLLAYFSRTSEALLAYCSVLMTGTVKLLPAGSQRLRNELARFFLQANMALGHQRPDWLLQETFFFLLLLCRVFLWWSSCCKWTVISLKKQTNKYIKNVQMNTSLQVVQIFPETRHQGARLASWSTC